MFVLPVIVLACATARAFVSPPRRLEPATRRLEPATRRRAAPREVTPEQEAQMKAMGYRYDEARRSWTRAPVGAKRAKPLRSGQRLLKVSADEQEAAEAFMTRIKQARKDSFRDTEKATELSKLFKYFAARSF